MKVQSLKLVYFSPTGTSKAVVQGISRGITQCPVEMIDVTRPDARKKPLQTSENELLVIAVPVYMGRVPALLKEKCITCCACIKNCPQNARTMNPGPVKNAAMRLNKLYKERKEPEFFF